MKLKKKVILVAYALVCVALLCACNNNGKDMKNEYAGKTRENEQKEYTESTDEEADTNRQIEKGYDLPIDAHQREEAEEDCEKMMGLISELYKNADKGCASNVVIADEVIDQMVEKLKATGRNNGNIFKYGKSQQTGRIFKCFLSRQQRFSDCL